ncbi:MAG: TerC family protein [Actinomycetes bacterium]
MVLIVAIDLAYAIRRRQLETTTTEALVWCAIYVGSAIAFGIFLGSWYSPEKRSEFFTGWLTEYSLSIDNIFVFILILTRLKVPKERQQIALLGGISLALVLRIFAILLGVAILDRFKSAFILFGLFLTYLGIKTMAQSLEQEGNWSDSRLVKFLEARNLKPSILALVALSLADLFFALDSIPAVLGITEDIYVVVTVNIFALLGLRQLYFLIGNLMFNLKYLTQGVSFVLAFIGVKLIFHGLRGVGVTHVGTIQVPAISVSESLKAVLVSLSIATIASLVSIFMNRKET